MEGHKHRLEGLGVMLQKGMPIVELICVSGELEASQEKEWYILNPEFSFIGSGLNDDFSNDGEDMPETAGAVIVTFEIVSKEVAHNNPRIAVKFLRTVGLHTLKDDDLAEFIFDPGGNIHLSR